MPVVQFRCAITCGFGLAALLALASPVRAGDFTTPIRSLGIKDVVAGPGVSPGDILEVRAGPGSDDTSFTVAALLRGAGSTTTLMLFNGRRSASSQSPGELQIDAIPQKALENVQAFSLGGGCRRGNSAVFPFVRNSSNNFRPFVLQVNGGVPSIAPLAVAGTDQVHSIECASHPNGQDVFFLASNASQARGELWKTTGAGAPALVYNNLPSSNSPFFGGIRPLVITTFPGSGLGDPGQINILYSKSNGQVALVSLQLNVLNAVMVCTLLTEVPPPVVFTAVRDFRMLAARGAAGAVNRIASAGDFDRNGAAELIATPSTSCAPSPTAKGSAAGGNGFNWTSYAAIANPEANWGYIGNGNSLVRYDLESGQTEALSPPLVGPGGPYDFFGGLDADSGQFGFFVVGARPGFPTQLRFEGMVEASDAGSFGSSFEGRHFDRWYVYNQ